MPKVKSTFSVDQTVFSDEIYVSIQFSSYKVSVKSSMLEMPHLRCHFSDAISIKFESTQLHRQFLKNSLVAFLIKVSKLRLKTEHFGNLVAYNRFPTRTNAKLTHWIFVVLC